MENFYAGAKKNPDGSIDLSEAAIYNPLKTSETQKDKSTQLSSEQIESNKQRKENNEEFFRSINRGGGNVEVQEAKLKIKDLEASLERWKDDPEEAEHFRREIELNQRVVNGERLVDVLDSVQTEEDKKRIKETRKRISEMKQE